MKVFACQPISSDLIKYYGEELFLRESHARKLAKNGKVKIIRLHSEMVKEGEIRQTISTPNRKSFIKYITSTPAGLNVDIPVLIPYVPNGKIGKAYNDAMKLVSDWVLFIDHDILLGLNPYWYEICNNAIAKIGYQGGWFTCFTNRIGCSLQKAPNIDQASNDIKYHQKYAQNLYRNNRGKISDVTDVVEKRFSGMFILTHKKAWQDAGGFPEDIGFFGVDCDYYSRLKKAGYRTYVMKDLYVYHAYFREVLKPIFKSKGEFECQENQHQNQLSEVPQQPLQNNCELK